MEQGAGRLEKASSKLLSFYIVKTKLVKSIIIFNNVLISKKRLRIVQGCPLRKAGGLKPPAFQRAENERLASMTP
ncbi:hypothetical protein Syun_029369 [Stephania yunnanensis]|uniref:Uncharacterized protein n=1 Tax=Stephania yunnanensis TaxID=152371 RepID=A0AAP0E7V2_9MAGN